MGRVVSMRPIFIMFCPLMGRLIRINLEYFRSQFSQKGDGWGAGRNSIQAAEELCSLFFRRSQFYLR